MTVTMRVCRKKIVLIALLCMQNSTVVSPFGNKAILRIIKRSGPLNSNLKSLDGEPSDSTRAPSEQTSTGRGYKFGDVTRGVLGAFQSKVNSLTGNDTYSFGDLTKWLDLQAKESALQLDAAAKKAVMTRVTTYTKRPDYKIGDITREIFRRFEIGEYKKEDLWLFIRICLLIGGSAGVGAATTLPVKVLLELLEVSMASSVSEDLTSMLTNEINSRLKEFVTGDRNYGFGDMTKKLLLGTKNRELDLSQEVVGKVTGKQVVEFSDISKNLVLLMASRKRRDQGEAFDDSLSISETTKKAMEKDQVASSSLEEAALAEYEEWEKKYLSANASRSSIGDDDFASWDERLVRGNDR